ncbi:MAG: rod shape-determining protein MreC [Cardiobacteriaceae bacterium]|nr:rod shape-determining protein MreC [Cardiobacteriaceae bacterium]
MWQSSEPNRTALWPVLRAPLLLVVLALILMVADQQTRLLAPLRNMLHEWVYQPVRITVQFPLAQSSALMARWQERRKAADQALQLATENRELRAQLQTLGHFQAENRRLRMLMDSLLNVTDPVLIAEIRNDAIDGYRESITINKGARDGVFLHQAVIDPYGLVGQVVEVHNSESRVMLVTDARSRLPVYVARTQQRALVSGTARRGEMTLDNLRAGSDIRAGDLLISSGLGGVFPRGYPVATVAGVERSPESSFLQVTLTPAAHLSSMLEVLLLDKREGMTPLPMGPHVDMEDDGERE